MAAITQVAEKQLWQIALVLGFVAMAIFANTIPNDYALDDELVTMNHRLTSQGIKAIPEIFTSHYFDNKIGNYYEYRPMVLASFAIEHSLFGDNPHVSHAINVLLYGLTCVVLFFVIRSFQPERNWLLPALATLLFAAHPLHTEVVASIKNRDEIFSFLFGISALFWSLKFARQGRWQQYALFVMFMVLSVISKRSVLSYAFIIPLAATWFSVAGLWRLLLVSLPLALLFTFFAPISNKTQVAILTSALMVVPVMFWVFKTVFSTGWQSLLHEFKSTFGAKIEPSGNSSKLKLEYTPTTYKWLSHGLVIMALSSLGFAYLDLRIWVILSLLLALMGTLRLPDQGKSFPLSTILFAIGLHAINYGERGLVFASSVLILSVSFLMGRTFAFGVLGTGMAFLMLATSFFVVNGHLIFDIGAIVVFLLCYRRLSSKKWWVPAVLSVLGLILLIMQNPTGIGFLLVAIVIGLHMKNKLKLSIFVGLGAICLGVLFIISIYPYEVKNTFYNHHLGHYYAQQPDPYGDGLKSVTNIVPGAGREVDFVENPLVAEKRSSIKLATAGKVMAYYAKLMVVPVQLRYYYGFNQISTVSFASSWALLGWLAMVALSGLGLWMFRRDRLVSFALLYLLVGLFFVSNIGVLLTGIVAERFVYGASLGYCLVLAWLLLKLFKVDLEGEVGPWKKLNPVLLLVVLVVFGLYASRSIVRNMDWKDKLTLYKHDAEISPSSAKVQQLLGYTYLNLALQFPAKQAEYYTLAEKHLQKAITIAPQFHTALYNLGILYSTQQNCKTAIGYFERFMAVSPPPPELILEYALCLDMEGRFEEAVQLYERFLTYEAYFVPAYTNLSYVYFRMGNYEKAIETNKRAIDLMPNESAPYINTGKTYLQLNKPQEALGYFEKAFTLAPNDVNLILTLWDLHTQIGDAQRGQMFYNKALELGHKP